jgi:hypothetical protein
MLHCTALHCTALHCTILYYTALYCTVLHCTMLHCTVLCCTALYYAALYCTMLHCTVLYCTPTLLTKGFAGACEGCVCIHCTHYTLTIHSLYRCMRGLCLWLHRVLVHVQGEYSDFTYYTVLILVLTILYTHHTLTILVHVQGPLAAAVSGGEYGGDGGGAQGTLYTLTMHSLYTVLTMRCTIHSTQGVLRAVQEAVQGLKANGLTTLLAPQQPHRGDESSSTGDESNS